MFLVFALLLMALGIGLFLSVYASFFPFFQSIKSISDYNVAYYSALSAVERGMLVTKYKLPGFDGQGGVQEGVSVLYSPKVDQSVFFLSDASQSSRWTVRSRTNDIPSSGEGNTDPFLDAGDSKDFNILGYELSEQILLSIDDTSDPETFYISSVSDDIVFYAGSLGGGLRLPSVVSQKFDDNGQGLLCDEPNNPVCDLDGDGIYDEVKVARNIQGKYREDPFLIIPTLGVFYYQGNAINYPYDNAIRASLINQNNGIQVPGYPYMLFLNDNNHGESLGQHTVISPQASEIEMMPFADIFTNTDFTDMQLSLGLISWLRSVQGPIYPYLEYRLIFDMPVADRFFTVDGHGRNSNYDVKIQIKKPTIRGTVAGDFTVIF